MHRRYLEENVVPRLRETLEALENAYLLVVVELMQLPDFDRKILERSGELRKIRNAVEEGKYALELCLKKLAGRPAD
jgi:hypothetical protein